MGFNITFKSEAKKTMGAKLYSKLQTDLWNNVKNGEFFLAPKFQAKTIKLIEERYKKFIKTKTAKGGDIDIAKKRVVMEFNEGRVVVAQTGKKAKSGISKSGVKKAYSAAELTQMQEIGAMWIIQRALKNNIKYDNWLAVTTDPKYRELVEIYPLIEDNQDWQKTFVAQNRKMLKVAAQKRYKEFKHYSRDGGFMDFISDLIKEKFGISQKDTWNPADIWLVDNQKKAEEVCRKAVEGPLPTIQELNAVMVSLFDQGKVIGISLKLVSKTEAYWEEVNVKEVLFEEKNDYNFEIRQVKCLLSVKKDGTFTNKEARIFMDEKKKPRFEWQIKSNDSAGKFSNLKYEPTDVEFRKARLGKAPVKKVGALLKHYNIDFENDWNKFPQTLEEYNKVKKEYENYYTVLKRNKIDMDGVKSKAEFSKNIASGFKNDKLGVATIKLMCVKFLAGIYGLVTNKREDLLTDMTFHAMKKGFDYGPFGKLY